MKSQGGTPYYAPGSAGVPFKPVGSTGVPKPVSGSTDVPKSAYIYLCRWVGCQRKKAARRTVQALRRYTKCDFRPFVLPHSGSGKPLLCTGFNSMRGLPGTDQTCIPALHLSEKMVNLQKNARIKLAAEAKTSKNKITGSQVLGSLYEAPGFRVQSSHFQTCAECRRAAYARTCIGANAVLTRWQEWCVPFLSSIHVESAASILALIEMHLASFLNDSYTVRRATCRTAACYQSSACAALSETQTHVRKNNLSDKRAPALGLVGNSSHCRRSRAATKTATKSQAHNQMNTTYAAIQERDTRRIGALSFSKDERTKQGYHVRRGSMEEIRCFVCQEPRPSYIPKQLADTSAARCGRTVCEPPRRSELFCFHCVSCEKKLT